METSIKSKVISHHNFLFPFVFENKKEGFIEGLENGWERFHENTIDVRTSKQEELEALRLIFNERNYFYPAATKSIHDNGKPNSYVLNYRHKAARGGKYVIEKNKKKYILDIDQIELKVYDSKIAILVYKLDYSGEKEGEAVEAQEHCQDVLEINEYGRRVYFPFLYKSTGDPSSFNADRISIIGNGREELASEDFESAVKDILRKQSYISKTVTGIINTEDIKVIIDDRMFVMSFYRNGGIIKALRLEKNGDNKKKENYRHYSGEYLEVPEGKDQEGKDKEIPDINFKLDFLYKYIYTDVGDPTCTDIKKREELINGEHVYTRWIGEGTLYGFSNYSFVTLASESVDEGAPYLIDHFKTIYCQMLTLVLAQRASLIKFSGKASEISNKIHPSKKIKRKVYNEIGQLQKGFIRYLNQIYHEEVTAQDQGIEIYRILQKNLYVKEFTDNFERQMDKLYEHSNLMQERSTNTALNIIAVASIIIAGLQIFSDASWYNNLFNNLFGWSCIVCGIGLFIYFIYKK